VLIINSGHWARLPGEYNLARLSKVAREAVRASGGRVIWKTTTAPKCVGRVEGRERGGRKGGMIVVILVSLISLSCIHPSLDSRAISFLTHPSQPPQPPPTPQRARGFHPRGRTQNILPSQRFQYPGRRGHHLCGSRSGHALERDAKHAFVLGHAAFLRTSLRGIKQGLTQLHLSGLSVGSGRMKMKVCIRF
jgi:hypothetical protein